MQIRPAGPENRAAVLAVEAAAFSTPAEAELVADLLDDPSAAPVVSLLAEADGVAVGHILFTRATVTGEGTAPRASILAPLAVLPEAQRRGVGRALIEAGVEALGHSTFRWSSFSAISATIPAPASARHCRSGWIRPMGSIRRSPTPGWCARSVRACWGRCGARCGARMP